MPTSFGRRFLVLALALVALLVTPVVATPAGKIVVYGAGSGSHLVLKTKGKGKHKKVVVKGIMARAHPKGCWLSPNRMKAVCPTNRANSIEVVMGDSGDFVKVKDRMPFPLTAYLGGGSDKFIGNGERDTCFSQGSRRNRCIGRGGNDICITGMRNSDCVGGRGNDYCRHQTGSDGCWGGPGNDVCVMGPGQDGCHGNRGNDKLFGGRAADQLYGGRGFDYCDGQRGWGKSHSCDAGPRR
jgi:Ca2+-binding RTX toxin-like protein